MREDQYSEIKINIKKLLCINIKGIVLQVVLYLYMEGKIIILRNADDFNFDTMKKLLLRT